MKNFLSIAETNREDLKKILSLTDELKDKNFPPCGKRAAMLFNKPSTRTRMAFEGALQEMGIQSIYLDYVFTQMVRGERLKDTAKAISQYSHLLIARLSSHGMLTELAGASEVPVINAATNIEHPCQAIGDIYTMKNHRKLKMGNRIVFVGDPLENVATSLLLASVKLDLHFTFLAPKGYYPNPTPLEEAKNIGLVDVLHDPKPALKDAAVVYTSSWVKESLELESPQRMKAFLPYQVNEELLSHAPDDVIVMHPLPAFRGIEIADDVLDGKKSVVWEQAKNRLHTQKALIKLLLKS